ncbi:MAG: roadblock/LC7 domain-containing protein [Actinomycetia bacterium]|nr:roadblock/LC7 domain-containing protein [Actinomycetes bacterium]
MEADQILKDLLQVSSQVESAAVLDRDGEVIRTTLDDPVRGDALGAALHGLVGAAEEAPGARAQRLVQLQVSLREGSVFVVRDEERIAGCLTGADPTPGLVFYDLKTCLRRLAGEEVTVTPQAWEGEAPEPGAQNDAAEGS